MTPGSTIGEPAWAECEAVIRRFEDAWRENLRPDIGDYLSSPTPHPTRLLIELVHLDLDFRLRSGEGVWTEDYVDRFPVLRAPELMLDFISAEYALRSRHRPPVWPEEFWLRFPELTDELRVRLPAQNQPGWFDDTRPQMRLGRLLSGPPVIPGYDVLGELGRGGMGVVYRVHDRVLNRVVAVKTFATVPRPDDRTRFAREAEAIARLDHPHIVPVYKVGEWAAGAGPAVPYFIMKWYPGGSLDVAASGPGTPPAAHARLVERIAAAVHHAHERGILHRDLKPSNILLDDVGQPHVADFGLAGRVDPAASTALTAVVAGTPAYMAPEQVKDPKGVSVATDVYGLGAILYHQLTGVAPFAGSSPLATLALVESAPAGLPSKVNPSVPRDLDVITLKCLDKNPSRRYASAAALADDLERWRTGKPIAARPTPAWEHAWRRVRRHPLITGLAAATFAALVTAVVVLADSNARIRAKEKETSDSLARETSLRQRLQESLTREQRTRYLERVNVAGRLYALNQLPQAWALLDLCPPEHRGWEWRYLNGLRTDPSVKLPGHTTQVQAAGFLPDGRPVTVDHTGVIRLWNAGTGELTRTWTVGRDSISSVHLHPTRNWVGVGSPKGVSVVDADTGGTVARPAGTWVTFSPDGDRAATGDLGVVRLWSLPSWEPAGELRGHDGIVLTAAIHPNGQTVVSSALDRTIRTWDLATQAETGKRSVALPVPKLIFAPGGNTLAECHFGAVHFTNPATGELRDRLERPTEERTVVAFGRDEKLVAVGGVSGEILLWDRTRHRVLGYFRGHSTRVMSLAFGPNHQLVSGGGETVARLWNMTYDPECRRIAFVGPGPVGLAVAPDESWVAVGPRLFGTPAEAWVTVHDTATGKERHRFRGSGEIALQQSTGHIATGRPGGGVTHWDPNTATEVWSRPVSVESAGQTASGSNRRFAFNPNGTMLASWEQRADHVILWDPADGTELHRLSVVGGFVQSLAFSPDGTRLATVTQAAVSIWDLESRTRLPWEGGGATAAAFSPDGQYLAIVEATRSVTLREAATGKAVRTFLGSTSGVNALAFSPDGTRLATGGNDKSVRIWDVESGNELLVLTGSTVIQTLVWDRTGNRLYALDDFIHVWSAPEK